MTLLVLEYLKQELNNIKPSYIITPRNLSSNSDDEWITVREINEELSNNICSTLRKVTVEINIIDRENYTDDTRLEVTTLVYNFLKQLKQVSYKTIRIFETMNVQIFSTNVTMYNKTYVTLTGEIWYE